MQSTEERWLSVVGYEGLYEVSDQGRVRSLDREYTRRDGVRTRRTGRVLKPVTNSSRRHQVYLCVPGEKQKPQQVHRLVLEAFVGPCPEGMEACHWDDNPANNVLSNLRWDSREGNYRDRKRNGIKNHIPNTHCSKGHEFTPENTYVNPNSGNRLCRECHREHDRNRYASRLEKGDFRKSGRRYRNK